MIEIIKENFGRLLTDVSNYFKTVGELIKIIFTGEVSTSENAFMLTIMYFAYFLPLILILFFALRIMIAFIKHRKMKPKENDKKLKDINNIDINKNTQEYIRGMRVLKDAHVKATKQEAEDNEKYRKMNDKLLSKYTPEELGKIAEDKCAKILDSFSEMEVFRNMYIYDKKNDENVIECDLIGVTKNAVFVFEVKSLSGIVEASTKEFWKIKDYVGMVKTFKYSPVIQNVTHVKMLRHVLSNSKLQHAFYNIVVIDDRTKLEYDNIEDIESKYNNGMGCYIVKMSDLKELIASILKERKDIEFYTGDIVTILDKYKNPTEIIKNKQLELSQYKNFTIKGF